MSTVTTPAPADPRRLSVDEFLARYNGGSVELVNGVVKEVPVAGLEHGMICLKIGALIFNHVEAHDLGRVMSNDAFIRTDPNTLRGGDVLFYSYQRLPREQPVPKGSHGVAPDLVIEVKSPSDLWTELMGKVGEYLKAGVRFVVVIDPGSSTVSIYFGLEQQVLGLDDTLTLPEVLPGFAVPVRRLFA